MTCALHLRVRVLWVMTCVLCVHGSWVFPEPALPPAKQPCLQAAGSCNDGDPCTNDVCDVGTARCKHDRVADYARCKSHVQTTYMDAAVLISEDFDSPNPGRQLRNPGRQLRDRCSVFCGCKENPEYVRLEGLLADAESELVDAKVAVDKAKKSFASRQASVNVLEGEMAKRQDELKDLWKRFKDVKSLPVPKDPVQEQIIIGILKFLVGLINEAQENLQSAEQALKNAQGELTLAQQRLKEASAKLQSAKDKRDALRKALAITPICIPYCDPGDCPCPPSNPPVYNGNGDPACVGEDERRR